ncbi:hypothetical protein HF086_017699 [Spodoptera exigua]|uniref:Major facilitator superfamily (MFS) profile domain-containing protein n=1 Tax=Spodoptera exigua TaxID=7107 RepID=A0A922M2V9_SPOEX|nr:hypothetical protein HF086_017699 [Spodoptera exigua]
MPSVSKCSLCPTFVAGALGALAAGSNLGWSAPIMVKLDANYGGYGFPVSKAQGYWMASVIALGAACSCYPIGFIMDAVGRKKTLLSLTIPFLVGWGFITFAKCANTLIAGRFITGLAGGALSVTAPAYASEVSQKKIRGSIGSLFQLMLSLGILLAVVAHGHVNTFVFNCMCACIPLIFCSIFIFMPESPKYLVMKGRYEDARAALVRLRGTKYDVDKELHEVIEKEYALRKKVANYPNYFSRFNNRPARITMLICFTLMLFQQLAGVGVIFLSAPRIFGLAGVPLPWAITTIILVCNQVVATLIGTLILDRVGRRILLLLSAMIMCICSTTIGTIFWLQENIDIQNSYVASIPIVCIFLFIYAYCLGFGAIPWIMAGDLCRMDIKAFVTSTAATISWFLVFVSVSSMHVLTVIVPIYLMFWIFACCTFTAFFFVFYIVPETKGLSMEDKQQLLHLPIGDKQIRNGPAWPVAPTT